MSDLQETYGNGLETGWGDCMATLGPKVLALRDRVKELEVALGQAEHWLSVEERAGWHGMDTPAVELLRTVRDCLRGEGEEGEDE